MKMNILRKGVSILVTLAMLLTILPVYALPETVEPQEEVISHKTEVPEGYTGIYSKADLHAVQNNLNGKYILMCDIVFTEEDFSEGGAYYNDGQYWEPIGPDEETPFTGIFDGNNYAVRNLQVYSHDSTAEWNFAGLFGCSSGTIHNLGMEDGKIVADDAAWGACAGAITGWNAGTIRDCYNTGSVYAKMTATAAAGYCFALAGGIVGRSDHGVIDSCWNSGTVVAEARDIAMYPIARAAGIVAESDRSKILRCTNTGYIRAEGVYRDGNYDAWVGGIAGSALYEGNLISECSNLGTVNGNGDKTGGIAGYSSGAVENCYNAGRVHRIDGGWGGYPGGIVGNNVGVIRCCYNIGEAKQKEITYWRPSVALVGYDDEGTYQNCYYPDTFDYGIYKFKGSNGTTQVPDNTYVGTAVSDEAMRQKQTYAGFDFVDIWELEEDGEYPYPMLKNVVKIRSNTRDFAGGRGTPEDPYHIATPAHLDNMRKYISAYYVLVDNVVFAESQLFAPICTDTKTPFTGYLDGADFTIENLQISVSATNVNELYVGLFGNLSGTVRNLELKGGIVRTDIVTNVSCNAYAGALAGNAEGALIENVVTSCQVDAVVTGTEFQKSPWAYAGGLVGIGGTLKSCYNSGAVTAKAVLDSQYAPTHADAYAGGIAAKNAKLENCTNAGAVLAQTHSRTQEKHPDYSYYMSYQTAHAAGIVAQTNRLISGCVNLGSVDARSTYEALADGPVSNAAGIVENYGYNYDEKAQTGIINCLNAGTITAGASNEGSAAAGIAVKTEETKIENCINSGAVTAANKASGIVYEAGSGYIRQSRNIGPVQGNLVAGIAYQAYGLAVSESSNAGTIITGNSAAGIIYGSRDNTVENCYNAGKIVSLKNEGYVYGIADYSAVSVKNCYNVGTLQGAVRWAYGIGGATAENCYVIDTYEEEENGAIRCTEERLRQKATYAGFDFTNVWTFDNRNGYPYPVLRCQSAEIPENTTDFLGGYGTQEHPFLIGNATQLNHVRNYLGSYFRLVSNIEFTDEDFAAGGPFHNDGAGWLPIGTDKNAPFCGQLDGAGFTIFNLKIHKIHGDYAGLFGVNWGTVKNMTLAEMEIFLNTTENFNEKTEIYPYIGGVAGYSEGLLEGNRVTGSITVTADCTKKDGGGLYSAYIGGIVGVSKASLVNCVNHASIAVDIKLETHTDFDASQAQSPGIRVFGGMITLDVGGVAGSVGNATVDDCHNHGNIIVTLENTGSAPLSYDQSSASALVGGVVGYVSATEILCCTNTADITASAETTSNTKNEYTSRASIIAGGIVGEMTYYQPSSMTVCANTGDLNVSAMTTGNNKKINSSVTAGGLAGIAGNTPITDSYNAGDIAVNISAAYDGSGNIGGLVGTTYVGISNCYNIGYLAVEHWSNHGTSRCDMGAIAGCAYSSASLKNCYYLDCVSSGTGFGTDTAIACSYQQLMDQANLAGFDFDKTWTLDGDADYAFPELKDTPVNEGKWVVGLVLAKQPDKKEYMQGAEELDITGAEVVLLYSDGTTQAIDLWQTHVRGFDYGKPGDQTIYLTWENYETSFKITVKEAELDKLEIAVLPDTLEFRPGDEPDLTGLVVRAYYSNGVSDIIYDYEVSYIDRWLLGEQTVTVTYQGKTAQFTIIYGYPGPDSITSDIYQVGDQYVTAVPAGTTVEQFLNGFNETEYLWMYYGGTIVDGEALVATGMELMLQVDEPIWLTVIVTGDINGDGKISVTDLLMVKSHLLGKNTLAGIQAKAADASGDSSITVTDYVQFKSHLLGKSQIIPH